MAAYEITEEGRCIGPEGNLEWFVQLEDGTFNIRAVVMAKMLNDAYERGAEDFRLQRNTASGAKREVPPHFCSVCGEQIWFDLDGWHHHTRDERHNHSADMKSDDCWKCEQARERQRYDLPA